MVDAVGRRGAVSVREHAEVPVVSSGLGDDDGEFEGEGGGCVETGRCAGFCGPVCCA